LWLLLQLFLGGGVAANYFDEIQGRPWHTKISETKLWIIGFLSLAASLLIGIYLAWTFAPWFGLFVIVWGFITITYDLELFNGWFHNTSSLAVSWATVCLGSYYLQSLTVTPHILLVSLCTGIIAGQGRDLYQVAKDVVKNKNPHATKTSHFAWADLKTLIAVIDGIAITMLTFRLLT
jgi:4-hydroxybenzoate polyprenyltransferase